MDRERVAVTGLGPVTPIGIGADDFHAAQLDGVSGIRRITHFDPSALTSTIAGEVDLPDALVPNSRDLLGYDRCTHLAMAAARLALDDSGLDMSTMDPTRIGVAIGTGVGGVATWEEHNHVCGARGPRP